MLGRAAAVLLMLLVCAAGASAAAKKPPRDILGLRLGMGEAQVRSRLKKIAKQQKEEKAEEEEGEQEVWKLNKHPRLNYLLVRFNDSHQLIFMTVVAHQPSRVRYAELADVKSAQAATDGRNYTYTWRVPRAGSRGGYAVVARGSDPDYLNSYSIYATAR